MVYSERVVAVGLASWLGQTEHLAKVEHKALLCMLDSATLAAEICKVLSEFVS